MLRFIYSLVVSTFVLWLAKLAGWIGFGQRLPAIFAQPFWNQFIWLAILALIFTVVGYLIGKLYGLFIIGTLGCGCFFFPVVMLIAGFVKLWAASLLIPGFTYTDIWWQVFLLSFFVGLNFEGTSASVNVTTEKEQD